MTTITRRLDVTEQQIAALVLGWVEQVAGVRLTEDELAEVGKLKVLFGPDPGVFVAVLFDLSTAFHRQGTENMNLSEKVHDFYRAAGLDTERQSAAWCEVVTRWQVSDVYSIDDLQRIDREVYELMRKTDHE